MLIYDARIWLGDGRIAQWMLLDGSRIAAIGSDEPPNVEERRVMQGAFVMPGFIDTHVHLMLTGLGLQAAPLQDAASPDEVWERMRSAPDGPWARGFGFDESRFSAPLTWDGLDEARPAFVERIDHHSAIVNRRGAALLAERNIPVDATGRVAGKLFPQALACVYGAMDASLKLDALKAAASAALRQGITTIHALEGGLGFSRDDLVLSVENADGQLGPRLVVYPQVLDVDLVRSLGLPRLGGCIWLDGSFGSRTAALSEPYTDQPETCGGLYFKDEVLFETMRRADAAGLQLSFHAIGDEAVAQAVRGYAALERTTELRHRIEHCELAHPRDLEIIAAKGIHLGVQPAFEAFWGGPGKMYEQRLGHPRMSRTNPFGSYRKAGIRCGGGSDSDVTPLDALAGIQAALHHPREAERLTVDEALKLFTVEAAALAHQEHEVGQLRPGYRADFVMLDGDPHEVAAPQVVEAWVDGVMAYRCDG